MLMETSENNHMPTPVLLMMVCLDFIYDHFFLAEIHPEFWPQLGMYIGQFIKYGTAIIVAVRMFEILKPKIIKVWNYLMSLLP